MSSLAFKNTDIGRIPSDWEVKKLGEVGSVKMCKRIFKHETSSDGDIPFFKIGTFGQIADSFISQEKFEAFKSLYPYPRKGTPLISAAGTIGRIVMHNGQDAYYQDSNIVWLEHDEREVLNPYLRYYYNVIKWVTETGSAITRLYNSQLLSALIAVPSIEEQRAIATALSDMDALIEAKSVLLEKKRAIKQGAMQELLSGRRRLPGFAVTPMKKTDIGEIPVDWMVYELGAIGSWLKGQPMSKSDIALDGKYECIHYGEIFTVYKEVIRNTVSKTNIKQKKTSQIGDIIFAASDVTPNGLARCSSVMLDGVIYGSDIIILRVKAKSMCSMFVSYSINYNKAQLIDRVTGTTVKHINSRDLSSVKIALPRDKEEQHEIALILSDMDAEIEILEHELKKLRDIKQGMMQELLTGRIRLVK